MNLVLEKWSLPSYVVHSTFYQMGNVITCPKSKAFVIVSIGCSSIITGINKQPYILYQETSKTHWIYNPALSFIFRAAHNTDPIGHSPYFFRVCGQFSYNRQHMKRFIMVRK